MSNIFISFLILHILGDFYIQTNKLAENKRKSLKYVFKHCGLYVIPIILLLLFIFRLNIIVFTIYFLISHLLIDTLKYYVLNNNKILKKYKKNKSQILYIFDQTLHITCIIIICTIYLGKFNDIDFIPAISNLISYTRFTNKEILKIILYLLIILNPVNVTFKVLFKNIKPKESESIKTANSGAIIGCMERLLIVSFLYVNQFTAIGLVLTGKSLARYSNIVKNKEFAEYYLVGTFYSILCVIIPYLIIFKIS